MCKDCVIEKYQEYEQGHVPPAKLKELLIEYLNSEEGELDAEDQNEIPEIENFVSEKLEQKCKNCPRCKKWGFFENICESCKNKKCEGCFSKLGEKENKYCSACLENVAICEMCKSENLKKNTIKYPNICLCLTCSKTGTVPLDDDNGHWYEIKRLWRDEKGDKKYYTQQWVQEHGTGKNRVRKLFGSTSDQCVGFELELLAPNSRQLAAKKILQLKGVYVERDGSLKEENDPYETGLEIISNWGSINRVLDIAKKLQLDDTVPSNRCGLHVHLTRNEERFGEQDLKNCAKMVTFWNDPINENFLKKFTRRWSDSEWFNNYSKVNKNLTRQHLAKVGLTPDKLANFIGPVNNGKKYHIVNLAPNLTIEIRGFAATKDLLTLNACIELAHYSYMFCRTSVDPLNLTWNNFMDWLPEESSYINNYLKKVG